MYKFIYVYTPDARDKLLAKGYKLMKSDEQNKMYIFINNEKLSFSTLDVSYILSDSITF